MQWDENKDVLMMREVLGASILAYKVGSKGRGQGRQKVAETLNTIKGFQVTGQGVRDNINSSEKAETKA